MDTTPRAAILAKSLQLDGPHGPVYGPIDMHVAPGDLVVLQGPQGSGRTSLLLTLAGRMKPSPSTVQLTVRGHHLPRDRRAVQQVTAIAGFAGIDDLEPSVTVGDTLRERLAWLTPWYRRTPPVTDATLRELATPVFGTRRVPTARTLVRDLDEVDAMLLRIVVALVAHPDVLVVDDLDQVHDTARRQIVWDRLAALTTATTDPTDPTPSTPPAPGLTVIASVASAGEVDAMTWAARPRVVRLTTGPRLDADPHADAHADPHADATPAARPTSPAARAAHARGPHAHGPHDSDISPAARTAARTTETPVRTGAPSPSAPSSEEPLA
ncbi:ATP-binding cassette domain-containing protein [Sanguibacter massiliensis]|uniref:ATP-binding cassette domain-containing protein n=1 Tax=Sanguibacter massiliensis TaxID=1973217 RepID=UPI001A928037|nr:ATP-binding cassette domain-containing protein [Sanguibacter massiliensis]